ncbi:MAG: hypothetical protein EA381_07575 [Planctomycetaceae bacterium]|nr:MAG: hypothetical protein EA381_07575 [Planctomycetaceae bacterium]
MLLAACCGGWAAFSPTSFAQSPARQPSGFSQPAGSAAQPAAAELKPVPKFGGSGVRDPHRDNRPANQTHPGNQARPTNQAGQLVWRKSDRVATPASSTVSRAHGQADPTNPVRQSVRQTQFELPAPVGEREEVAGAASDQSSGELPVPQGLRGNSQAASGPLPDYFADPFSDLPASAPKSASDRSLTASPTTAPQSSNIPLTPAIPAAQSQPQTAQLGAPNALRGGEPAPSSTVPDAPSATLPAPVVVPPIADPRAAESPAFEPPTLDDLLPPADSPAPTLPPIPDPVEVPLFPDLPVPPPSPPSRSDRIDRELEGLQLRRPDSAQADQPLPSREYGDITAVRPVAFSCDDFRTNIAQATIQTISLDISPPFRPDVIEMDEFDKLRNRFQERQEVREWTSVDGRKLGRGRLHDMGYEKVIIETEFGTREELPISRIAEADLAYISEQWGLPDICLIDRPDYQPRAWQPSKITWKASNLMHNPLYFQDVNLERYGHTAGPILQPVVSSAHFFANIATLPYQMGVHLPRECQYPLGYYRPGDCAPWITPPVPLSLRGALFQAGAVGAAVGLIP